MQRRGFTMVELIFVIVIIGILATMAMPKFDDTTNRAKINSELSGMESMAAAIRGAIEFHVEDFGDAKVNWHNYADMNDSTANYSVRAAHYGNINKSKLVLKKIAKKNDKLRIAGWAPVDSNGNWSFKDGLYFDILMVEGEASNSKTGVPFPKEATNNDIPGKPDRNDFWVFNPSPVDIVVVGGSNTPINKTVVESGSLVLVDVNGTKAVNVRNVRFSGLTNGNGSPTQFYFTAPK
ncbi:MAG: prepilin-type N-terminal cleavage/methylation domain-containing protein [Epsilonproteobacteria bacterium]|nr:prepilin-type N-terminal cleavage/methylation domain-containing protein [Campylobacterota bacterium]